MALKGVVIDPGHGGVDPGAVYGGRQEKDYNLKASLYMYDRFKELGIPVKLTRNTDETLSKSERVKRIINAFGNSDDVIVISNHINAGGGDGAEVVYALRNDETLAKSVLNNIAKTGQNIRKFYQRRLPEDSTKDYYFIHRETGRTEPILVEYGFIDSKLDDISQLDNNINDYAEAVVKAVLDYSGIPYYEGNNSNSYIVKNGDTLYSISLKYGVSVEDLKKENNLVGNMISKGQVLNIPVNKSDDKIIYIVKKGDTLWNIANKFGVSVNDIVMLNNLSSANLSVGMQILIPKVNDSSSNDLFYSVKNGDTLWSISKKYNVSINDLKSVNNLNSNMLFIGQELKIPSSSNYKTYVVKSGDSLFKIASLFGINLNDLIKINNLSSDLLSIGQTILIP